MSHTAILDRRRHDLRSRIARAIFPIKEAANSFLEELGDLPCYIIGHHYVEVPPSLLSRRDRTEGRMRFKCSRCHLMGGFSNRRPGE